MTNLLNEQLAKNLFLYAVCPRMTLDFLLHREFTWLHYRHTTKLPNFLALQQRTPSPLHWPSTFFFYVLYLSHLDNEPPSNSPHAGVLVTLLWRRCTEALSGKQPTTARNHTTRSSELKMQTLLYRSWSFSPKWILHSSMTISRSSVWRTLCNQLKY